ncbi:sensor histidine kinase [[Actinomadura] parvosata]|uniref:sensor histidine kinase n=1 Tax=[Actinomadura] parvosata TaxID=1955412 RepID=UPI00406BF0AF
MILVQRARSLGRSLTRRRPRKGSWKEAGETPQERSGEGRREGARSATGEPAQEASREGSRKSARKLSREGARKLSGESARERSWAAGRAIGRPFALALFEGDADPPPAARRLTFKVPRRLRPLVPFTSYSAVQAADLVLAFILYGLMLSVGFDWNETAGRASAANPAVHGPVPVIFLYLAAIGASLPVALRDRWPLAAWRVAAVMAPIIIWATGSIGRTEPPYPIMAIIMYLLVLYSVAVRCERRIVAGVWVLTVLAVWIVHPDSMFLSSIIASVAVLFGYNVRARRTATSRLAEEERRSRQAEGAQAVLEERARIARELHDVVAHHMSVIAIQAEAVPLKAAGDAAQLEAGLAEIRGLSLEAIAQLRQVLGVLRDPQGRTDTAPQPGLDRIDELVSNARAAGLAVVVKRSGSLGGQPQAVELSAYRIVQESLSNVMRHAPGATVAVEITRRGDELRLRVANGPGTGPHEASGGAGQGLVGMRERAALLGGRLDAGATGGGGFEVRATLPITEPTTGRESA